MSTFQLWQQYERWRAQLMRDARKLGRSAWMVDDDFERVWISR